MSANDPFSFLKFQPPASKPAVEAPPKSAQELHDDEVAWRNAYRNNSNTASYFWVAERAGATIGQEYDECDCADRGEADPTAHRNHFSDLPGKWVPTDDDMPTFRPTESFEPFVLHAVPVTLDTQDLPEMSFVIEPLMKIVWGHRTIENTSGGGSFYVDALLFGRVDLMNGNQIHRVYHTGEKFSFDDVNAAVTHENEYFTAHHDEHPGIVGFDAPADQS